MTEETENPVTLEAEATLVTTPRPGVTAMSRMRMRIPGDQVNLATADLPEDQRSAIRWLHAYAVDANLTHEELAALLKKEDGQPYSKDSVYQSLTGRRASSGASLAPFVAAILRLQKITTERSGAARAPFIETPISRRISKVCEAALTYQRILFMYGDSQIGKSRALLEYTRTHNHGQTIYVRMPTRGTLGEFIRALARVLRIGSLQRDFQIKERIFQSIDSNMLLIVDQCHECFRGKYSNAGLASLLFCMEIFDRSECGLVLSGTGDFEKGMMDNRNAEEMKQLLRRGFPKPLRLPAKPDRKSLDAFSSHYGLPPATTHAEGLALQTEIIKEHDLGIWLTCLQSGARIAKKANESMTWDHVKLAHAGFLKMAGEDKSSN